MSTSSRNGQLVVRLSASEDKKERLKEVYCEDKIALSSACKVVGIQPAISTQKCTQYPYLRQKDTLYLGRFNRLTPLHLYTRG